MKLFQSKVMTVVGSKSGYSRPYFWCGGWGSHSWDTVNPHWGTLSGKLLTRRSTPFLSPLLTSFLLPRFAFVSRPKYTKHILFLSFFFACGWAGSLLLWAAFSYCSKWGLLSGFSAPALGLVGSGAVAHRLSCPSPCGIFPDQGSNTCRLH